MSYWFGINSSHYDSHCGAIREPPDTTILGALDGTDVWNCPLVEAHWFILDLATTYLITRIRSRSNTPKDPQGVNVYVSDNKLDWTQIASNIDTFVNTSSWVEIDTTDKIGRYIKVEIQITELPPELLYGGVPTFKIFDVYVGYSPPDRGGSGNGGGWMIFSIGGDGTVNKTDLLFLYNGTYYTWTQATTNDNEEGTPLIDKWVYEWNYTNQNYNSVDTVNSWKGYWQYYYFDVAVYYPIDTGDGNIILVKGRQTRVV